MLETWMPVIVAILGSFASGYFGVQISMARMEERHIALTARVDKHDAEIGDRHSGIRGDLHKHHNRLGRHASRLMRLEEKVGLPPWDERE
jgi:hypothetical protein